MLGVLCFTLSVSLAFASDRRLIKQINSLREDLSFANSDTVTLFEHFEKMNETIWSNKLGYSMAVGEENMVRTFTDMFRHEFSALLKGFESEKKINRRDIQDVNNRLDAGMNKCNTELTKLLERTNHLNMQLSEQAKALEKSSSDLRKELQLGRESKARVLIDYEAMKSEVLELVKNASTIIESLDCMPKNTPDVVTLQTSTVTQEQTTSPVPISRACKDEQLSGVYEIFFDDSPTSVYCDADIDGGGWIVIMRHQDGSVDFNRTWDEYKHGFGDVNGDFWIRNKFIHELTKSRSMELRVEMEKTDGTKSIAKYAVFKVGSEADKYVLTVSGYSGTAGEMFVNKRIGHDGMKFTTYDQDNARNKRGNCARYFGSGWWYNTCYSALLAGVYSITLGQTKLGDSWYFPGVYGYIKYVDMKIR